MDIDTVLKLAGLAFSAGAVISVTVYRLRRVERILKKAHLRIDRLTGEDWITTGVWKRLDKDSEA